MYPKAEFEQARLAYPGRKRGADTEYDYYLYVLKKKKLREATVTPLLLPAIREQIAERSKEGFHPHWKYFKSWLLNTDWEIRNNKKPVKVCFGCKGSWSSTVMHPELNREVPVCWPCKQKIRGY